MDVGNNGAGDRRVVPDVGNDGVGVRGAMMNVRNCYMSIRHRSGDRKLAIAVRKRWNLR